MKSPLAKRISVGAATALVCALSLIWPAFARHRHPLGEKGSETVCQGFAASPPKGARTIFEQNLGQAVDGVEFLARIGDLALFVDGPELTVVAPEEARIGGAHLRPGVASHGGAAARLRFGSVSTAQAKGRSRLSSTSNYLRGSDQSRWIQGAPNFGEVVVEGIVPGADLLYRGEQGGVALDLLAAGHVEFSTIEVTVEGAGGAEVTATGSLRLAVGESTIDVPAPRVVSASVGQKSARLLRFTRDGVSRFTLEVSDDVPSHSPLLDAPALIYSTYLGGLANGVERSSGTVADVALDADGSVIVVGQTWTWDFPVAGSPPQPQHSGRTDCFVTKLTPDGSTVIFSTFLGGSGFDAAHAVSVGGSGAIYVAGDTGSPDFPANGIGEPSLFGDQGDVFVAKVNPESGAVVYSTRVLSDGRDVPVDLAVDADGAAHVAIWYDQVSPLRGSFPTTAGAFDVLYNGSYDVVVGKLSPSGSSLLYATYLGGAREDVPSGIAIDAAGRACVTGTTRRATSPFPTTPGAHDVALEDVSGAFVTQLAVDGSALVFSTLIEGVEEGGGIAVAPTGEVFVSGRAATVGGFHFPTTPGAYQESGDGAFVAKLSTTGTQLIFATLVGGDGGAKATSLAIDEEGAAYITGAALHFIDVPFPTTSGAYDETPGGMSDVFVSKIAPEGDALVYSTLLGAGGADEARSIALDASGAAVVVGDTTSASYPVSAMAFDTAYNPLGDTFVTKVSPDGSSLVASTFLQGDFLARAEDIANAVAVDAAGAAYVTGYTQAIDFPLMDPFDGEIAAAVDAVVTKLSPSGQLVFSTYIGGADSGFDRGNAIAVDTAGAVYVTGFTQSVDFPTTPGAFDTTIALGDSGDAFVLKLTPDGATLVFSTFLGGDNFFFGSFEEGLGIGVDAAGEVIVAGTTGTLDFPVTSGAYDTTHNGRSDLFIAKLSADGSELQYSTYFGGSSNDACSGFAVDADGAVYVAGSTHPATTTPAFPVTAGAYDTTPNGAIDAFAAKLAPDGSALAYSTFLGGSDLDAANGLAVDSSGAAYVSWYTSSTDFATTHYLWSPTAFTNVRNVVTKLSPDGAATYSTLIAGARGNGNQQIAVHPDGSAVVVGGGSSAYFGEPSILVTPNALQQTSVGETDAWIARLTPEGDAFSFATFFGGAGNDVANAVAVAADGSMVVTGLTASWNFPNVAPAQGSLRGEIDMFVTRLTVPAGTRDSVGVYSGQFASWFLRDSNSPGPAHLTFVYGPAPTVWVPLAGDWNGDGIDTAGLYSPANGFFLLRAENAPGPADLVFAFGPGGLGFRPLVGDWDGDGVDTVGVYDPSTGAFFLSGANESGPAALSFIYGPGGMGLVPVAGDFDGDGTGTVGLYAPTNGTFFLKNTNAPGPADLTFQFGVGGAGIRPLVGDYNGDGVDTVGLFESSTASFFLTNRHASGAADHAFVYGGPGQDAVIGDWNAQ